MTDSAGALKCPNCGAAVSSDATQCEHCGTRLATVACPSCFGMMFAGEKFCPHCGAQASRTEVPDVATELCPRCAVNMTAVTIGKVSLRECPKCEGIWADAASLQQICADREEQAAVLGVPAPAAALDSQNIEVVRYLPCPVCHALMNRVNFAHCSHVIVDVCNRHGTWFDRDELRRIVEFIRAGGMEQARAREISELQEERSQLQSARSAGAGDIDFDSRPARYDAWSLGISTAADVLKLLFK